MRLPLTHMALHKVAYYAHGWRLAETGCPLLTEEFEAWEHGPVLPTVYGAFKAAGRTPISFRAERFNPATQQRSVARGNFSPADRAFLRNILRAYGRLDALTLSDMTHRKGGPWDRVWNAADGKITLGMKIKNQAIRAAFLAGGQ
ncbi:MAG TPA: type II toxin-antitoxin system antitoxin SocA domain-containing protein [Roseomonas sp.]|nr:type II toxin-antitoxin system antitoxin SocA domain-containing protein [Roseomonas sp.]